MQQNQKYNSFSNILNSIKILPHWVLQGLYVEVATLLKSKGKTKNLQLINRSEMVQLFVPVINSLGERAVNSESAERLYGQVGEDVVAFLQACTLKKNIIDICIANKWTFEQCCQLMLECVNNDYIERNYAPEIHTTIQFIAGDLKVGEFLVRKGFISQNQLEWALKVQGDLEDTFENRNKIVEVLSNLSYIDKDLVVEFLDLKEFARSTVEIIDNTKPYIDIIEQIEKEKDDLSNELAEYKMKTAKFEKDNAIKTNKINDLQTIVDELSSKNNDLRAELDKLGFFKKL